MTTVGAYEAKTHLPALLEQVARGAKITITKHGKPVARLVPMTDAQDMDVGQAITDLKALRKGSSLGEHSWKDLRDTGRK